MRIDIVTIFPEMIKPMLNESIMRRAIRDEGITVNVIDLRDYSILKHNKVDDTPYGGGAGMVLQFPPFYHAINALKEETGKVLLTSPRGVTFDQKLAIELAKEAHLIILCGHYEGIDERVHQMVDEEISIGDYVLTGGELAAMVITDAVVRLQEGVIKKESYEMDSFQTGILEHPHYTKPASYEGFEVPFVLTNGNHKEIDDWRRYESLKQTWLKRPDLLAKVTLSKQDLVMLEQIKKETNNNNV
ncbi:MAG TPA: tRNA (guanosine(37)-N1)-methyltransferase TrmD [Acholeplasma sp.]|nr:tRNA (guanosine(37)-N1)-methyltransferase TrmD [Acholeplasma sp.]